MDDDKMTADDFAAMFGDDVPVEVMTIVWEAPSHWTVADVRWVARIMAKMALRTHELEALFDLQWDAHMRGVAKWQEETGKALTLPDTADFTKWLLEKAFPDIGTTSEEGD